MVALPRWLRRIVFEDTGSPWPFDREVHIRLEPGDVVYEQPPSRFTPPPELELGPYFREELRRMSPTYVEYDNGRLRRRDATDALLYPHQQALPWSDIHHDVIADMASAMDVDRESVLNMLRRGQEATTLRLDQLREQPRLPRRSSDVDFQGNPVTEADHITLESRCRWVSLDGHRCIRDGHVTGGRPGAKEHLVIDRRGDLVTRKIGDW
jgi:hypothetical protein